MMKKWIVDNKQNNMQKPLEISDLDLKSGAVDSD